MELYIARHGETEANATKRFQGNGFDTPLTDKGIAQAKALGKSLEGINFDAIYSSPLERAMNTTRIAFNDITLFDKKNVFTDNRLVEVGLGDAEGSFYDEVKMTPLFEAFKNLMQNPVAYIPPKNAEALPDMLDRVDSFLRDIATKPYKRVFVCAHGYVLRVVYACAKSKSVADIGDAPVFDNCALARYIYDIAREQFIMYTSK